MPPRPVLELRDLDIASGSDVLVRRLTLDAVPGRVLCIVSESATVRGALSAVLTGQAKGHAVAGDLAVDGRDMHAIARGSRHPIVAVGSAGEPRRPVRESAAEALLQLVGATAREERLSALGIEERIRVDYAIALTRQPAVLLVDLSQDDRIGWLAHADALHRLSGTASCAVLVITDSLAIAADVADDVLVLLDGHAVEWGSVYDVCLRPAMPYVQELLQVTPAPHRPLPDLPAPAGLATHGCPWVLNCRSAVTRDCSQTMPPMRRLAPGHHAACHLLGGGDGTRD